MNEYISQLAKRGCKGMGHRKRENISSRTGEKVY
jgi:hypothetical protein